MIQAPAHVVDFEEALRIAGAAPVINPWAVESAGLLASRGRVLAEAVLADRDQPPFDRSTRDGFAVKAEEFGGNPLAVVGSVRAGEMWAGPPLGSGQAIEIMTGAPVPAGADAVAMVEHVVRSGDAIRGQEGRRLVAGENVVARGREARSGQVVLEAGRVIGAAEIALAAACGCGNLSVWRRPTVAIVATGDELVEVDVEPGPQQIRNSNSYALAAMVEAAGGVAVRLPVTPDRRDAVAASLRLARACGLVILSGGVSMGEYDLIEEMLLAEGAKFFFTGVRMQPGKPVVFGRLPERGEFPERLFFGLPGNPISTQVTFHCFVEPLLRRMCGERTASPRWGLARLSEAVAGKPGLTRLLPGRLEGNMVTVVGWQGSGDLAANARADGYVELPADQPEFAAGQLVRVLMR